MTYAKIRIACNMPHRGNRLYTVFIFVAPSGECGFTDVITRITHDITSFKTQEAQGITMAHICDDNTGKKWKQNLANIARKFDIATYQQSTVFSNVMTHFL